MSKNSILIEIINLLRSFDAQKRTIHPETLIFTELDFDSLQMLDLIETLKNRYGVDLLSAPNSFQDMRTPHAIAMALARPVPIAMEKKPPS